MCARYELTENPRDLLERFGLTSPFPSVNMSVIRPTDQAMIVGMNRHPVVRRWGFDVDWTKQPMINARSETLLEKPTFRPHLNNRCLVPATHYFEWRNENGVKHKNTIHPSDQRVFAMAGLVKENQFTIITCQPSHAIAHIHNRMPVLLRPEYEAAWLDPEVDFRSLADHLIPYERADLIAIEDTPPPPRQGDLFSE